MSARLESPLLRRGRAIGEWMVCPACGARGIIRGLLGGGPARAAEGRRAIAPRRQMICERV